MQIYDGRESFYQWDINQKITSTAFKVGDEIHFTNLKQSTALVTLAYNLDGKVVADVPNILLQSSHPIRVYRYVETNDSAFTIESFEFNVIKRTKADDYVYCETELYTIKQAVDKALLEAKESGEFDGEKGEKGEKGDRGEKGDSGDDYVLTDADKTEIANIVLTNFVDVSEVGQ